MNRAGFDGRDHLDAGGKVKIFKGGARDDGRERETGFEIDANEGSP